MARVLARHKRKTVVVDDVKYNEAVIHDLDGSDWRTIAKNEITAAWEDKRPKPEWWFDARIVADELCKRYQQILCEETHADTAEFRHTNHERISKALEAWSTAEVRHKQYDELWKQGKQPAVVIGLEVLENIGVEMEPENICKDCGAEISEHLYLCSSCLSHPAEVRLE